MPPSPAADASIHTPLRTGAASGARKPLTAVAGQRYDELNDEPQSYEVKTVDYVRRLSRRKFPALSEHPKSAAAAASGHGAGIDIDRVVACGFSHPLYVPDKANLPGLVVPSPEAFTVGDVARIVGESCPVNVINVATQTTEPDWDLGRWWKYVSAVRVVGPGRASVILTC